jgi:outer membrane protein assembly factor BamB
MGYGGSGLAFADTDGDGLDEVFCGYPICYWKADGRTGELRLFKNPGDVLPGWPAYAVPIVADFNGDREAEVFFPSQYVWGMLTLGGQKLWNLDEGDLPGGSVMPGIGDVDGDGKLELGAPFPDGFRCYDAATGERKWAIPVPNGPYAGVVSADLDADGRDEFLFGANDRVVAVGGHEAAGGVVWEVKLPGRVSEPTFADVDGDGLGEILVTCGDGRLCCLGG